MSLQIRAVTLDDVPELMQIASDDPSAPHWTADMYRDVVEQSLAKRALINCAVSDAAIIGFYVVRQRIENEWELESIVVAQEFRNQGIGRQLMQHLFSRIRGLGVQRLLLEVRESNVAARGLYSNFGFREDGVRRNYYSHPQEDAVLFSRTLTATC